MGPTAAAPGTQAMAAGGSSGCVDLMSCYGKCDNLAVDCTSRCDTWGTPDARAANAAVFQCIAQFQCRDEPCVTANCGPQLATCVNTPGANLAVAPGGPGAQEPPPPPPPGPAAVATTAAPDEVFEYRTANGTFVPEVRIVAHGLPVQLQGVWREGRHDVTLELTGATYLLKYAETAHGTGGVAHAETGDWQMEGPLLVLIPRTVGMETTNVTGGMGGFHQEGQAIAPDPARRWNLEGTTLEWVSFGPDKAVHHTEGLVIQGPAPSWAGQPTTWTWTLRRAR